MTNKHHCKIREGKPVYLECPHCKTIATVFHLDWTALGCGVFLKNGKVKDGCGNMVDMKDWKTTKGNKHEIS